MALPNGSQTKNKFTGRTKIYTGLTSEEISSAEAQGLIGKDLEQIVLPIHMHNVDEMDYLYDYYSGYHKEIATRQKETRQEINNKVTFNFAKSFTRDIVSYLLSKPIDYVQRASDKRKEIGKLNHILDAENKELVDENIATDMSIVGVGYRGVFVDKTPKNGTHIKLTSLDPRHTFLVHSANPQEGALYAVTYYTSPKRPDDESITTHYTVYTKLKKFEFTSEGSSISGAPMMGGLDAAGSSDFSYDGNLPIIEYANNAIRIGDWESELSIMDALDKLGSDSVNDVEQFVNSILYIAGIELTDESFTLIKEQKVLNASDIPVGVRPEVKYIADQLDANSISELREYLEATLRAIVGVPDRKSRGGGGGDTGDAVYMRDGWQDMDLVASAKEKFFIQADRASIDTILYVLKLNNEIDKGLNVEDIDIKFSRNKHSNVQAKAQAYATLVSAKHPIDPFDALEFADLTNDIEDVIMRSDDYAEKQMERQIELLKAEAQISASASNSISGGNSTPTKLQEDKFDFTTDGDE